MYFSVVHAVIVAFNAERLTDQDVRNIKQIMELMNYQKGESHLRFNFIATHADSLLEQQIQRMRDETTEIQGSKHSCRKLLKGAGAISILCITWLSLRRSTATDKTL